MAKDPAFLFYPNDWIGGTMGMTFEEKGAYIELLMMQFNRGHMTEHMIGLTVGQLFGRIKDKFKQDEQGLWFNERLENEKESRKKYVQSRVNNKLGANQYSKNRGHTTSHMEDEDRLILDFLLRGEQESKLLTKPQATEDMVVLEMMKVWMYHNPNYYQEDGMDYSACLEIAYKIAKYKKWKQQEVLNGRMQATVSSWNKIVVFVKTDSFLNKLSLTNLNNQFQNIVQKMNNPVVAKNETDPSKVKIKL